MTQIVDHPRPCAPLSPHASTVLVDLSFCGMPGRFEQLVVEPSSTGGYVVACLPWFTYGIQFGDLVAVKESDMSFERVVKSSGLRTLRAAIKDQARANNIHERLHGAVVQSGLPHEWHGSGYVAVLLRNIADQLQALRVMLDVLEENAFTWEVDPEPFQS